MNESQTHNRQLDLVRPSQLTFTITVIGAGGIGSWTTLALAKMGCSKITVIDDDKVEIQNIANQYYTPDQVGQQKATALRDNIKRDTGIEISLFFGKFQEWKEAEHSAEVVICAVDSLEQRKEIWKIINSESYYNCFIDARMAGELVRLFVVSPLMPSSVEQYEKSLTGTPYQEPCTSRAVAYNVFVCAGMIGALVKKYAKQEEVDIQTNVDITSFQIY